MRSVSWRTSGRYAATFFAGVIVALAAAPVWREIVMQATQAPYAELVFKCDNAMREQLIAKQVAIASPSAATASALQASELALLDCQDYDIYQKRLQQLGLRENELSLMRLKAIEERATTLHDVVDTHEIRY